MFSDSASMSLGYLKGCGHVAGSLSNRQPLLCVAIRPNSPSVHDSTAVLSLLQGLAVKQRDVMRNLQDDSESQRAAIMKDFEDERARLAAAMDAERRRQAADLSKRLQEAKAERVAREMRRMEAAAAKNLADAHAAERARLLEQQQRAAAELEASLAAEAVATLASLGPEPTPRPNGVDDDRTVMDEQWGGPLRAEGSLAGLTSRLNADWTAVALQRMEAFGQRQRDGELRLRSLEEGHSKQRRRAMDDMERDVTGTSDKAAREAAVAGSVGRLAELEAEAAKEVAALEVLLATEEAAAFDHDAAAAAKLVEEYVAAVTALQSGVTGEYEARVAALDGRVTRVTETLLRGLSDSVRAVAAFHRSCWQSL